MAPNEFTCVECWGSGRVLSDNGPNPRTIECDCCGGSGAVDAHEYLDQCWMQVHHARTAFHLRYKAHKGMAWEAWSLAKHWMTEAKKARAKVLEHEHAGAAHTARAAA